MDILKTYMRDNMLKIETLFDKFDVECPPWLNDILEEDEWLDSKYSFDGTFHKWVLHTQMFQKVIKYNGTEYEYTLFDLNDTNLQIPLTMKRIDNNGISITT